jgi:hypothetical protein
MPRFLSSCPRGSYEIQTRKHLELLPAYCSQNLISAHTEGTGGSGRKAMCTCTKAEHRGCVLPTSVSNSRQLHAMGPRLPPQRTLEV